MAQAVPLQAPEKGALGLFPQYCFNQETTLKMKEKVLSWTGDDFTITTTEDVPVCLCAGKVMSMSERKGDVGHLSAITY